MTPNEQNLTVFSQAVARSWRDPGYRQELVGDPGKVLREAGMSLPENVQIKALEDTAELTHVVLPKDAHESQAALRQMAAELGHQVKVVHNSDTVLHLPIPPAAVRRPQQGYVVGVTTSCG